MKKINIAELLKDCPKGMELDCTMYEDCKFLDIDTGNDGYLIRITTPCGLKYLDKYGRYTIDDKAKCVIFPKGKTTWEGFQRPFKDGDVITCTNSLCSFVSIFKEIRTNTTFNRYASLILKDEPQFKAEESWADFKKPRLATEEEKQKLFDAIKANGYKWNPETKTLEKLIEPKFKVGDRIKNKYVNKGDCASEWKIINVNNDSYTVDCSHSISFENQDNYELIINNQPKFKVGDKITNGKVSIRISHIDDNYYYESRRNIANRLLIKDQDDWRLVKFDITTLKPFEKVLIRYGNFSRWNTGFFSHTVKSDNKLYFIVNTQYWEQCIPYEGNEYLCGTTYACSDYFKTWE